MTKLCKSMIGTDEKIVSCYAYVRVIWRSFRWDSFCIFIPLQLCLMREFSPC